jgi:hypothetical protein
MLELHHPGKPFDEVREIRPVPLAGSDFNPKSTGASMAMISDVSSEKLSGEIKRLPREKKLKLIADDQP